MFATVFTCTFASMKRMISFLFLFASLMAIAQEEQVSFSTTGGFYEETFLLELWNRYPSNRIFYTTNGATPTPNAHLYTQPLMLDESLYSRSDIYTIAISPDNMMYYPDSVKHCIVLRAAVFNENDSCISPVVTQSYFIHSLGCGTHGLPVISLCADSLDLFDYYTGILVPGFSYNENVWHSGNYYKTGEEWERPCNIEFYETDNDGINQQGGLRTHGNRQRERQQKGLKVYAREKYGKKHFKHKFFENISNDSFKRLTFKPFDCSWNGSGINDYICQSIARTLNVECLATRASELFLNGEYWGIYYVQEKHDEHYLEDHHDIDPEAINLMTDWNGHVAWGSADNFIELFNWIQDIDLALPENYNYLASMIDMDNFIDYQLLEIFTTNVDWPSNNVRFWQENDGIMRWIFFDGDGALSMLDFDVLANATYDGDLTYPSSRRSTLFFRKLLANDTFRSRFTNRFNELIHNEFSYQTTHYYFEEVTEEIRSSISDQSERFHQPTDFNTWLSRTQIINNFIEKRPDRLQEEMLGFPPLSISQTIIELNCYPNPFREDLNVIINCDIFGFNKIEVYNMMGQVVYSSVYALNEGECTLPLHLNLPAGVYVLNIGNTAKKIVCY